MAQQEAVNVCCENHEDDVPSRLTFVSMMSIGTMVMAIGHGQLIWNRITSFKLSDLKRLF